MLLHEFGHENKKTIIMIHGLSMSWDMFLGAIHVLEKEWRVFAVAVPGMDMDEENEFTSVEEIAVQIADALIKRDVRTVDCIYGLSMGGGIALRMLADQKIGVRVAVLDGGITPYELPYMVTRLILAKDVLFTLLGKTSEKLLAMAFPPDAYTPAAVTRMYEVIRHMTLRTIWRAYDSTDNYSMPDCLALPETDIWYWYGEKESKARRLDLRYVRRHVKGARFRKILQMSHGQYVIANPVRFAKDIKKVCR